MYTEVHYVDAEDAAAFLKNNDGNREMSRTTILQYAKDMIAGRWSLTAEAIQVMSSMRLLNGQHRMAAVIEADKTKPGIKIPFLIAFDVPEDSFTKIDQGRKRTGGAMLALQGFKNASNVSSAVRLFLLYSRYNNEHHWNNHNIPTQSEVMEYIDSNIDLVRESNFEGYSKFLPARLPIRASNMMALKMIVDLHSAHADKFEEFTTGVALGANLTPGDPRLVLRERSADRIKLTQWGYNGNQSELGVLLKAWNAFVEGRSVTSRYLSFTRNELPLPKPI